MRTRASARAGGEAARLRGRHPAAGNHPHRLPRLGPDGGLLRTPRPRCRTAPTYLPRRSARRLRRPARPHRGPAVPDPRRREGPPTARGRALPARPRGRQRRGNATDARPRRDVRDGFAERRGGPASVRGAGTTEDDREAVLPRRASGDTGRVRAHHGDQPRALSPRLGARYDRIPGRKRHLARGRRVLPPPLGPAIREGARAALSPADRGGLGVRLPRRRGVAAVFDGPIPGQRPGQLRRSPALRPCGLRRVPGADDPSRHVRRQRLGAVRHARQRMGVVRRPLRRGRRGAGDARRVVAEPRRFVPLGESGLDRTGVSRMHGRVPRRG